MAITGIIGLPGSGKTLEAVRLAKVASEQGIHVYANMPLNLPPEKFTLFRPEELGDIRDGFILLDEAHLWLPARRSLQLPMSWLTLFSQTRKIDWLEFVWTAQHETRVDRMLRDVCAWMIHAQHYSLPFDFFTYTKYEPEKFRRPKCGMREWRRRSASASALYDTKGGIIEATHVQDRGDPYANRRTVVQRGEDF